jgi:serine/threonine-protein kinase
MSGGDCPTDAELAAFVAGQVDGQRLERLAGHLMRCAGCQRRLEQADRDPGPVVRMLRRPVRLAPTVPAAAAPSPPARQRLIPRQGALRQEADGGTRLLYYRRVRLASALIALVLALLLLIRIVGGDPLTTSDSIRWPGLVIFALLPAYAAGTAVYLWLRPGVSLDRLRLLAGSFGGLCALAVAYRQYAYLTRTPAGGFEGPDHAATHLTGANALCVLEWFSVMVFYGVLVPDTWRRVLGVVGAMGLASLGAIAAAGLVNPALRAHQPFLLTWTALVLGLGVAAATFASFQVSALRREASEARRLGQYVLKERLGTGGMGEVYRAEHRLLKRPCAVKLIRPDCADDPELLRRFEREVQVMATLTHPNTVEVYDYGHAEDGTFYYAMEYLPGPNLETLVRRHGPLPPGRVVYLLRQLCGALREAHAAGLIHRDVKPGNVLVCRQGGLHDVAKLLDFGLVRAPASGEDATRLTEKGTVMGTPDYMAPEQARGAEVDGRGDIYALGAVAYFLLTGRPPFVRETAVETMAAHLREPVPPPRGLRPDLPADLEVVVLRCLAKDPAGRYADVDQLEQALAGCACAGTWTEADARAWWHQEEAASARESAGR